MKAMIRHENGKQPYSDGQLNEAIKAAGWVVVPMGGGYTS
jgi:DNA-directed RNA polymerase specialized sigma54-like protein